MFYDYLKHTMFEILICINNEGKPDLFRCVEGNSSSYIPYKDNEPPIVYHYCNYDTFKKIMASKRIWLTDLFRTNDYSEVIWFFEQFKKYINSIKITNIQQVKKINTLILIFQLNLIAAYSSSFSELKDSLSQWRGYGEDGNGIAIGINPRMLNITRNLPERHIEGTCINTTLAFIKVNYNEDEQIKLIKKIIDDVLCDKARIWNAGFALAKIAYTCKNWGWHEENEWRILYTPIKNSMLNLNTFDNSLISSLKEGKTKNDIVSNYAELKFQDNFISEIIIGPKNNVTKEEIIQILQDNTINIKNINIIKSQITYR